MGADYGVIWLCAIAALLLVAGLSFHVYYRRIDSLPVSRYGYSEYDPDQWFTEEWEED